VHLCTQSDGFNHAYACTRVDTALPLSARRTSSRVSLLLLARVQPAFSVCPCLLQMSLPCLFLLRLEAGVEQSLLLVASTCESGQVSSLLMAALQCLDLLHAVRVIVQGQERMHVRRCAKKLLVSPIHECIHGGGERVWSVNVGRLAFGETTSSEWRRMIHRCTWGICPGMRTGKR
jgi:hypothetical protein